MAIEDTFYPAHFRIEVTNLTGAAPKNGFVDATKPEEYASTSAFPSTLAASEAKERANMRWLQMIETIEERIAPIRIQNIVATGADENTEASTFAFTITVDRPEYLDTEDELNAPTRLQGADAVKRWVAKSLMVTLRTNREIYNPTTIDSVVQGPIILELVAEAPAADLATAEGAITVTEITM